MPSVVQVQSPVAGNPVLQIEQIAANMQRMRNMGAQENLMRQQAQMAPQQMAMKKQAMEQAQALQNAQIAHLNQMTALGQTTPVQRNLSAFSQYGAQPQGAPPQGSPVSPDVLAALSQGDQAQQKGGPNIASPPALSGQDFQQRMPQQTASLGALGAPSQQMAAKPQTVENLYPRANPAQAAYISKVTGLPTNAQWEKNQAIIKQAQSRAASYKAHLYPKSIQLQHVMDSPTTSLADKQTAAESQLPLLMGKQDSLSYHGSQRFNSEMNRSVVPAVNKFMQNLGETGLTARATLTGAKFRNYLSSNQLDGQYNNMVNMLTVAGNTFKQALGESSTDKQMNFAVDRVLTNLKNYNYPAFIKNVNELMKLSHGNVEYFKKGTLKNSAKYLPKTLSPNYIVNPWDKSSSEKIIIPAGLHTKEDFNEWLYKQPVVIQQKIKRQYGEKR